MQLKVIGPVNSGTNLMTKILENNLIHHDKNVYVHGNNSMKLWKHCNVKSTIESYLDSNKSIVLIFMYKNILNLMSSMCKNSYCWRFKNIAKDKIMFGGNTSLIPRTQVIYENKNIIQYFESYYQTYKDILNSPKYCNRVIFIDYKKIIDRDNAFDYIQEKLKTFHFDIKYKDVVMTALDNPSKRDKYCVANSNEAFKQYRSNAKKEYKRLIMSSLRLDKDMDLSLLKYFEENQDFTILHRLYFLLLV